VNSGDIDHAAFLHGSPANLQVLGHSPIPLSQAYTNEGRWGSVTYADFSYYTDPTSLAGVIDTGTTNWIDVMAPCPAGTANCPATAVSQITGNILWLFGQGPAGHLVPSVPNRTSIVPADS
jgi:hypothetical protein